MKDLKNSEIIKLIDFHFKTETEKSVIKDRFINVLPFEKILDNNFPEMAEQSVKTRKRFISKTIIPLCSKFEKVIASIK